MLPVIDIFAGPGGLSEGFSALTDKNDNPIFEVALSIEKGEIECQTLALRAFCHQFQKGKLPVEYYNFLKQPNDDNFTKLITKFPKQWKLANKRVLQLTLGPNTRNEAVEAVKSALGKKRKWVLVGGPPCQAYSLVGRARRKEEIENERKSWEEDSRRVLYKEYLHIIRKCKPTAFVMENVKGLLSAEINGLSIYNLIARDFDDLGYSIHSLVADPSDYLSGKEFLIKAEEFGIPQTRHRIIIIGIKKKYSVQLEKLAKRSSITIKNVIDDLPKIRSGISKNGHKVGSDVDMREIFSSLETICKNSDIDELAKLTNCLPTTKRFPKYTISGISTRSKQISYEKWYRSGLDNTITLHHSRNHMKDDIKRYVFCAIYGKAYGISPKIPDFPTELLPKHANVNLNGETRAFVDRFKVQLADKPSSTITSHISKDSHYYIHYDPKQGRGLSVREAARIQTFPDDYFFYGGRTAQYHQVGNAVPPLLAYQIAEKVAQMLKEKPNLKYFSAE